MVESADLPADLPAEAEAAEVRDLLPDDLDARGMVGPYVFPDNDRRRIPGVIYLALALATVVAVLVADGSPLVDGGLVAEIKRSARSSTLSRVLTSYPCMAA